VLLQKIKAMYQIFRPELPLAAGVCVVLGSIVALGGFPPIQQLILGFMCGFFISGSAIIMNDYFDLDVDRINAPDRPLPAGILSPSEAVGLAAITMLIGLAASLVLGLAAFMLCVVFGTIGFLYNWKFKESGFLGNLVVSSNVGITFILGGIIVGDPWNAMVWMFALIAFFIDLGEEIAGDAMDVEGDKKRDSQSIAIRRGKSFALAISASLFSVAILLSLAPVFLGWLGIGYLGLVLIIDIIVILCTIRLLKSRTPEEGRLAMRGIYMSALVGMLAFLLYRLIV
jgi:geranylgeranylglycerol-phosphate geranylgeranyltransferase